MKNPSDYELLSAYLDGELSPAEQTRAERLIADDPAARQLFEEMRTLGTRLKSLPRQTLSVDLSQQVLQAAAERSANQHDASRPASQLPASSGRPPLHRRIAERIKGNPRMVIWPLIVVSVAFLLMVFNPDQNRPGGNGNRDIAMAPKGDKEERAEDAKLVEPKQGELAKSVERPSMRAANTPENIVQPSQLVMKGNAEGGDTKVQPSPASRAGLTIIQCQVNADVLKQQDYRKVFEANNIAIPEQSAAEALQMTPVELATVVEVDPSAFNGESKTADAAPKAKVLLVEVTPAQIGGMINSLKALPETFREVSVKTPQWPQAQTAPSPLPPSATKRVLVVFRTMTSITSKSEKE